MAVLVESKRSKLETLQAQYPGAVIVDVTSKGNLPWVKFSPFFPHGNIPVPFSSEQSGASVEGIWQGLKVFEHEDVDVSKLTNATMQGIKRSVRSNGNVLGHRAGIDGERLLSYRAARYLIYLPTYKWVLDHCLQPEIKQLNELAASQKVVLLDYETNGNVENLAKPLSHAALIVKYIENKWPSTPTDL
jgi:hypothetical protein